VERARHDGDTQSRLGGLPGGLVKSAHNGRAHAAMPTAARATALVTGASSGIGRSLARLFARDGYNLALVARRVDALQELAAELTARYPVTVKSFAVDLARPDGARVLQGALDAEGMAVDVLVNNAGVGMQGAFSALPVDRQLEMIRLNVMTLTELTGRLLPGMLQRGRGGVLNVGSTAGFQPGPFMAVYYATKAYVVSFSEALAEELSGSELRVSCLAPGATATGFAAEAGAADAALFKGDVMDVEEVARIGYEGWKAGKALVIAGRRNRIRAFVVRLAPRALVRKAVRRLNR
jgi:short-subunit dehydrogenase